MKLIRLLAVAATLSLVACSKPADQPAQAAQATPAQPPLVTVNGAPVSRELFDAYTKAITQGKEPSELTSEQRDQIKEDLVRLELLAQQADKEGLTRDPEVATRLELTRLNLLQQSLAQHYLKDRQPTEAELRAEYETQLAATPLVEYHARHILLSSPDTAQKLIEQLQHGGDFATLAKRFSADKGSAAKGGDLGWFSPTDMVKPFADAVGLLKNGEITTTPVQTQFGSHVIQLLGTRDRSPPTYEAVEEQLKRIVLGKKFRAYSEDLMKTAKIDPPLGAAPAAPGAPAATEAPASPAPAN